MPKESTHKKIARPTRRSVNGRTARRPSARKPGRGRRAAGATTSGGDTLFTIRFEERSGAEVFGNMEGLDKKRMLTLYENLLACYARAHELIYGSELDRDFPVRNDSLPRQLAFVIHNFRQLIPREFDIKIDWDEDKNRYQFVLWQECFTSECWHFIEVGPALLKLYRENRQLHDLFVEFLRALRVDAGVCLWDEWSMGSIIEGVIDLFDWMNENYMVEIEDEALDAYILYNWLEPAEYSRLIMSQPPSNPMHIQKRAARFKPGNPIANLIYQGAELLKNGYHIRDYDCFSDDDYFGIDIRSQFTIVWNQDDIVFRNTCEDLDTSAQEGVQPFTLCIPISPDTNSIDFGALNEAARWPKQLSDWCWRANELIIEFERS